MEVVGLSRKGIETMLEKTKSELVEQEKKGSLRQASTRQYFVTYSCCYVFVSDAFLGIYIVL